jgi:hypothetical protein
MSNREATGADAVFAVRDAAGKLLAAPTSEAQAKVLVSGTSFTYKRERLTREHRELLPRAVRL